MLGFESYHWIPPPLISAELLMNELELIEIKLRADSMKIEPPFPWFGLKVELKLNFAELFLNLLEVIETFAFDKKIPPPAWAEQFVRLILLSIPIAGSLLALI